MRTAQVLRAVRQRLRPSRWGALPLFLGLLLGLRLSLGTPWVPFQPRLLLVVTPLLAGYFFLSPMPWQWTGDDRLRPGLLQGAGQALAWNALWLGLLSLSVHAFLPHAPGPHHPPEGLQIRLPHVPHWAMLALLNLPVAFLAGWFVAEKEAADAEAAAAARALAASETAARQAQVRALQAQLDPHVLYNALGGLAELIRREPARAEEALLDLADLYRALTGLGQRARIPLGEERALVARYLALEHLRLGPRLRVAWDWPEDLDANEVPPLLVQPLVENALKHGIGPHPDGGEVKLSAAREGRDLVLRVANSGLGLLADREGTGLGNLRERLALLPEPGSLLLTGNHTWTLAELRLPGGAS